MLTSVLFAESGPLISIGLLDWAIIVVYFLVVLGIGFYLKRFAGTGEDFFMAGRKMTAWIAGVSFISANLSSLETMGWSAMAYQYGMLGAHAYLIGAIPAILFLAIVMMPFYYICKTHSVPGYLKLRYGEGSSALAGISFALMTVLVSGSSMFAMAKILHLLLGWDMNVSIWVSSLTVAIYVTLGGLISAVFNEVLQFFLIWFGSLLIPILGLIDAGGWNGMVEKIRANVPTIHPDRATADFTSLWGNLGSFTSNPMGIDWFGMVFGLGLAVSFGYWCTDFLQVQRVIVAKNLRAAQNGTIIGAVLKMCVPLIVTIPGLLGLAVLMNGDSPVVLVPESDPRANITHRTFNDVLPLLMGQYLGPGLLGLGVTAMIAGFMSGMAGNVSAFATVWTYDVYRPLFYRTGTDRHYLNMGRWSSLVGVLASIGTAYLLFFFSNILEYLQVLIFFFIVPLFGVVTLGMLWKRATPAGGFWGFLIAMLFSISMWAYVHTFPNGHQPDPRVQVGDGAVVALTRDDAGKITQVKVEKGSVTLTNIRLAVKGDGALPLTSEGKLTAAVVVPARFAPDGSPLSPTQITAEREAEQAARKATEKPKADAEEKSKQLAILAPKVKLAGDDETKFGVADAAVIIEPGVAVTTVATVKKFNPAAFNPDHVRWIARSKAAQPMAVNMYSGLWTLCMALAVAVGVSLFTKPKPDAELKNLVMGLTPLPDEGKAPWYESPYLWATLVGIALVAINIIFW